MGFPLRFIYLSIPKDFWLVKHYYFIVCPHAEHVLVLLEGFFAAVGAASPNLGLPKPTIETMIFFLFFL